MVPPPPPPPPGSSTSHREFWNLVVQIHFVKNFFSISGEYKSVLDLGKTFFAQPPREELKFASRVLPRSVDFGSL